MAAALAWGMVTGGSPQLLLSLRVLVQRGLKMVPHFVVPPVHWKMHVPWLQMVMAEGSVGHTVPHEPLQQHAALHNCSELPHPPAHGLPSPAISLRQLAQAP